MIRVRRASADAAWLERHELRLNPDDWPFVRERILAGELDPRDLRLELRRRIAADPGSRRAGGLWTALEALGPAGATE